MTIIALIVAVADNGVIGNNNELPWRISADLKYFRQVTLGKPIIMGRRTYESIGKPLPGRTNIVMTRDAAWQAEGLEIAGDLTQALVMATKIADDSGVEEVMVIGGETIYREALSKAQRLYLTRVHTQVDGDAFFPDLNKNEWLETRVQHIEAEGQTPACTFVRLDRK
ncbi:MAG: dihydrofolate reductase [Porticoccaceae bacterium]|nr:dihydrofolate reductase [Porticoccaceae bacterium]